jgi:hypothetical protein
MRENSVNNMAAIINKQIVTRLAENIVILDSNYFYRCILIIYTHQMSKYKTIRKFNIGKHQYLMRDRIID